jgi:hypothetical protein
MIMEVATIETSSGFFMYINMERTKQEISIDRKTAISLLGSEHYLILDKRILNIYKPNTAIFLSNLIDFYKYLTAKNKTEDEWFYCTYEQQQEHINLSEHELRNCKNILIEDNILQTKKKGIPSKEWYYVDFVQIIKQIRNFEEKVRLPQDLNAFNLLGLKASTSIYRTDNIKRHPMRIPPKLKEIQHYCQKRNNNVDPEKFYNFYASKGWKIGKNKMVDWHAAIRTWEKEDKNKIETNNKVTISKFAPAYKTWDGIRYYLNMKDGEYYTKSGEKWID